MLCSENTVVKSGGAIRLVSILRCKRWNCELCHPFNRRRVIRHGIAGRPDTFITLTVQPNRYADPSEAARDLKRAWVLLRRAIFKKYGIKNIPFLAVFEKTQLGWPHLHVLARAKWIDQKWLSEQMKEKIGAPVVDIRRIFEAGRCAAYVAKYVGKDPEAFKGCKRWWRSHNYDVEGDELAPLIERCIEWWTCGERFEAAIARYERQGYKITSGGPGWALMESGLPP